MNPIFEILSANTAVNGYFGASPTRIYPYGEAPEKVQRPYAVWQQVGGSPENYLGNSPDIDSNALQFDVYARDARMAREAGKTLRNVIEQHAHLVSYNGEFRDTVTRDYRYSFSVDWYLNR